MKKLTTMQMNPNLLKPSSELMEIQSIMPIAEDDRKRLEDDIKANGVRDAIKVYQTEDGEFKILGGMNRWEIAKECEIDSVTIDIYQGEIDEYRKLVRDDNLNRRHLTPAQKRSLVEHELFANPEKSNRQIAEDTKVSHVTVGTIRREKEESGQLPVMDKTVGKDGKERTTEIKRTSVPLKSEPAMKQPVKKTIKCTHCGEEIEI